MGGTEYHFHYLYKLYNNISMQGSFTGFDGAPKPSSSKSFKGLLVLLVYCYDNVVLINFNNIIIQILISLIFVSVLHH